MTQYDGVIDACFITVGTITGIANIKDILGVIILVFQVIWIVSKFVMKLYRTIKLKKDISELDVDAKDVIDTLNDIRNSIDGGDKND